MRVDSEHTNEELRTIYIALKEEWLIANARSRLQSRIYLSISSQSNSLPQTSTREALSTKSRKGGLGLYLLARKSDGQVPGSFVQILQVYRQRIKPDKGSIANVSQMFPVVTSCIETDDEP